MHDDFVCLLIHGYGGSPFELQPVAAVLQEQGFEVECPLLPGHGRNLQAFRKSRYQHWFRAVEQSYISLFNRGKKVFVIGLSMGGTLGLQLAEKYPLAGLTLISAPVFLYRLFPWRGSSPLLPFVPALRFFKPVLTVPPPSQESNQIAPHNGYEGFQALHPLNSFLRGLRIVRRDLGRIKVPLLVIQCPQDQTVPPENGWEILRRVQSRRRRLELVPIHEQVTSKHVLTTHLETKARVRSLVLEHLTGLVNPPSVPGS
jgi:carboxylesterase